MYANLIFSLRLFDSKTLSFMQVFIVYCANLLICVMKFDTSSIVEFWF